MKITAVHVDTLELATEESFVIASSAFSIGQGDLVRVETDGAGHRARRGERRVAARGAPAVRA